MNNSSNQPDFPLTKDRNDCFDRNVQQENTFTHAQVNFQRFYPQPTYQNTGYFGAIPHYNASHFRHPYFGGAYPYAPHHTTQNHSQSVHPTKRPARAPLSPSVMKRRKMMHSPQRRSALSDPCRVKPTGDGRRKFIADLSCKECCTFAEAKSELESRHGGRYKSARCILNDGNNNSVVKSGKDVVPISKYHCRATGIGVDGQPWKCKWRAQIRTIKNPLVGHCQYVVYRHMYNEHCHSFDSGLDTTGDRLLSTKTYGMDPTVMFLVKEHITKEGEMGVSVLSLKPRTILSSIITNVRKNNTDYMELRHNLQKTDFRETVAMQITGYLSRKKQAFIKSKLDGVSSIANNETLQRVLSLFALKLPFDYVANDRYTSPKSIADALGVNSDDHMFIIDLTHGRVYDTYLSRCVKDTPAEQKKARERLEQGFLVVSPTGLFQLLTLAKRRDGTRCIGSDGSGGFCKDGSSLVTIGTPAVRLINDSKKGVRSSLRTHVYLHLGGERYHPYLLSLYVLRDLCLRLFGIALTLDWGVSDHADTFIRAHNTFKGRPAACDSREPQRTEGRRSNGCLTETEPSVPWVTQSTQDVYEDNDLPQLMSQQELAILANIEGALDCYFHIQQNFKKKADGFVSLFDDPSLKDSKESVAYKQVRMIQLCKTKEQRDTLMKLVLLHWRIVLKEDKAADRFEKEYCTYPYWNWNYAATGEVGVYPTNCPNESLNKVLKSEIRLNVALPRLLVESLPELLKEDANVRCDPCVITYPDDCDTSCVALTGFYKDGVDVIELRDSNGVVTGFLCNLGDTIGVPLTHQRWLLMTSAKAGDSSKFCGSEYTNNEPGSIAYRMVEATRTICEVTINKDGTIIGDCESCYKRLGRDCPAATYIRNRYGKLRTSLEDLRKVPITDKGVAYRAINNGDTVRMYTSGPSTDGRRPRQMKPMMKDFKTYLSTMMTEQLHTVVNKLGIRRGKLEKPTTHGDLLGLLYSFYDDATSVRANIKLKQPAM